MSRLTKKDYKKWVQTNGYYTKKNAQHLTEIQHKLGEIENLMEKYKINSIEELENILASKVIAGGMRSGGKSIVGKGMLYNKLSEELGCDLYKLLETLKKGKVKFKNTTLFENEDLIVNNLYFDNNEWKVDVFDEKDPLYNCFIKTKDLFAERKEDE